MILQHRMGLTRPKKGIAHKLASFSPSKRNSKKTDDFVWFALHGRGKKAKIDHLLYSLSHTQVLSFTIILPAKVKGKPFPRAFTVSINTL